MSDCCFSLYDAHAHRCADWHTRTALRVVRTGLVECVCMHKHTRARTHTPVHAGILSHTRITHPRTHTHTCTHAHMHTCTHAQCKFGKCTCLRSCNCESTEDCPMACGLSYSPELCGQAHILKSQYTVALYSKYAWALTCINFFIHLHRSTAERESATRPLICLLKIQNGASVRRGEGRQLFRLMRETDKQPAAPVSGM